MSRIFTRLCWSALLLAAGCALAEEPFNGHIAPSIKDSTPAWPAPVRPPQGAPNVVLILLDDVGFGAASTFGGAAQTPALDALAARGLRYNNFHTAGVCSPTRASLLTGRNHHQVGFGFVTEAGSGFPGYNGIWKKSTASIAKILRDSGYATAAFGKWHNTPKWEITPAGPFDRWPTGLGFEYFYGFQSGSVNQWEPGLFENTVPVQPPATPAQGYHLTADLTDKAIGWLHTQSALGAGRPYFLYFATAAIHSPHQVPKEWIDQYRGRFDAGWDQLHEDIFAQQKKLGVIPANTRLTPRPRELPAWNTLSADERKFQSRQMEVYAAFMAHTDHEIARLLQAIASGPQADNTLIIYIVGDNGADGNSGPGGDPGRRLADLPASARLQHLDELGSEWQEGEASAGWAWATSAPFQWTKGVASHFGGTRNPLVVSWPARIKQPGGLRGQFTHVNDIAATLLEAAGIPFPKTVDGYEQLPLEGTSLLYSFEDSKAATRHRVQYFELVGNRAIYQDGWVAAARHGIPWLEDDAADFEKDRWELYHVSEDFSQARDLAARFPDKLKSLQALFDSEARRNQVYPLINLSGIGPRPMSIPRDIVYYPDVARFPAYAAPDLRQSHRITAEVDIPPAGVEGVILSEGGRYGGFSLYVKDDRLIYEHNYLGQSRETVVSTEKLPRGAAVLAYEFARDESPAPGGIGRLYIDDRLVGEARLPHVGGTAYFDSMSIGRTSGPPLTEAYVPPYAFTGILKRVRLQMK